MKRMELLRICKELATRNVWCIPESAIWGLAGYPDKPTMRVAMSRHVKAGVIKRIATKLYQNPFCDPPMWCAERLANFLRPNDNFYLSLESALHEWNWISQIPQCLTFVTTGRTHTFDTLYGRLIFVHTEEDSSTWSERMQYETERQIWVASPEKAFEDMKRYGKNLDLILPEGERGDW